MEAIIVPLFYPLLIMFIVLWVFNAFLESVEVAINLIWGMFDGG